MSKHHSYRRLILLMGILALTIFLFVWGSIRLFQPVEFTPPRYGITFSTVYADTLGINAEEAYRALIEEMGVRAVRIPLYWSEIEQAPGQFDWERVDRLVKESNKLDVRLTLVVGEKVPRWPECYLPDWAEVLSVPEQQKATLSFIEAAVERYKNTEIVERWQVENEPFFPFGNCRQISAAQFQERVDLVRHLDPSRPIQITVSGEMGPWTMEAEAADILGISMYRFTWNDLYGYFMYPLIPEYYYARAQLIYRDVDQVIVSELQAEPWFPEPIERRTLAQWYDAFTADMFQQNIQFVEDAHISEAYLWGAEWWYLLHINGDDRLWNVAKTVF